MFHLYILEVFQGRDHSEIVFPRREFRMSMVLYKPGAAALSPGIDSEVLVAVIGEV